MTTSASIAKCNRCKSIFRMTAAQRTALRDELRTCGDYCPTCKTQPVTHSVIVGRVVDTITCGGRCTSAKSGSCDCSCGGENHGSDYARIK